MPETACTGWDIGGAHLKAARLRGDGTVEWIAQLPCSLWRGVAHLEQALSGLAAGFNVDSTRHVLTMTGELVDAFAHRRAGVDKIIAAFGEFVRRDFAVYAGAGGFIDHRLASARFADVASLNWHATASLVARRLPAGVLVDIGSTTTDLVPFRAGRIASGALSDSDRMLAGELVYTGVARTPVMAIADRFDIDGQQRMVTAELFATSADVYRLLGELPEHADLHPACDGAGKDEAASARRLARMFGCDYDGDTGRWRRAARSIAGVQQAKVIEALGQVCAAAGIAGDAPLVGAGAGCFVAQSIAAKLSRPFIRFDRLFDFLHWPQQAAECAAALSVACLAHGDVRKH